MASARKMDIMIKNGKIWLKFQPWKKNISLMHWSRVPQILNTPLNALRYCTVCSNIRKIQFYTKQNAKKAKMDKIGKKWLNFQPWKKMRVIFGINSIDIGG